MASIAKRATSRGPRYDVRYRVAGAARMKTFKRAKDAETFKRKVEGDELVGLVVDLRGGEETFKPYAERWIATRLVKGRPLSLMTKQGYEGILRRTLNPTYETMRLRAITPEVVREWHAEVVAKSGADAAAKAYRLLRAILNTAVDEDRLGRNPCRIKGAGAEHPAERPMVEASVVFELADAIGERLRAFPVVTGFGGLRTGEMLGLRRRDVDLMRGEVRVAVQAQQIVGAGRVVSEPKSDAGKRTVALPRVALEALEEHMATFTASHADAEVFVGPRGKPLTRAALSEAWRAAVKSVGAPKGLRPHDLRHHAATLMARMPGVTTKELMARIGHASPRAALIYQHATEERDRAIATFLDAQIAATKRPHRAPVAHLTRAVGTPLEQETA